jgi:hypothetical protein
MIGRPEWFERRKYGGWGYRPKTWQGWLYTLVMIAPFIIVNNYYSLGFETIMVFDILWITLFGLDAAHIIVSLRKDEREARIESLSERNAAWIMVMILAAGFFYEFIIGIMNDTISVNPVILAALLGGMIVKTVSNLYYGRKSL